MKGKIALLLSFVFILTLAVPVGGFAANMDKALENAIKIAKTKFSIPDDYKFTSNIGIENNKNVFSLNWRSTDVMDSASINVRIDENGTVIGYNKYSQSDYVQTKKLPKLSRQDAKAKADAYIKWIDPGLLDKISYEENYQGNVTDISYYFTYYRVVNGIPFYNDMVNISINRDTGALLDYSRQWTENVSFPDVKGSISLQKAQEAYAKNLGVRLIYKYFYTNDVVKTFAVYAPVYDNGSYGINALTGERQRFSGGYFYGFNEKSAMIRSAAGKGMDMAADIQLSPDEMKAVQNASKLMSRDEAEKIARSSKFLGIPSDSKLQSYYLGENWPSKEEYIWSLQFVKPADDKNKYEEYTNVSINAKTGDITSFYRGAPATGNTKAKLTLAEARSLVEEFLKQYYPQYYRQTEYDTLTSESNLNGSTDTYFNFVYSRLVNGVAFPDNGISVNFDNLSGTITGFNLNWFDIAFPSVDKAIVTAAACNKLFGAVGLELNYKPEYTNNPELVKMGYPAGNSKIVPVYTLKRNRPLFLDANTGSLINGDGSAYKEMAKVSYNDIKGIAAEKQIMVLADNGVYLEGKEFKPNTTITQKDFLTLLSKTMNYYGPVISAKSTAKEIDEMYAFLQREGVIKPGEKATDGAVTREEAVKYLIRALKYDKVADIKGIFSIGYSDKASISPGLSGYVAIASGLGIVDSKSPYLKPKAKLTRAESAVMIYNYLQS